MSKPEQPQKNVFAELIETAPANDLPGLLNEVFPDLRCLRCDENKFALIDDPDAGLRTSLAVSTNQRRNAFAEAAGMFQDAQAYSRLPILTIACRNCGHIEQFAEDILRELASKK